jgi:hypothetical protein
MLFGDRRQGSAGAKDNEEKEERRGVEDSFMVSSEAAWEPGPMGTHCEYDGPPNGDVGSSLLSSLVGSESEGQLANLPKRR